MRKIHVIGLTVAALALCAVAASPALAVSELLLAGNPVQAGDIIHAVGSLLLNDLNVPLVGEAEVLCEGIMEAEAESSTKASVLLVLNLAEETIGELGGLAIENCTNVKNCATPLTFQEKLPWPVAIVLDANGDTLLELGAEAAGAGAAFDLECMGLGLSDLCEGLVTFLMSNGPTDVLLEKNLTEDEEEKNAGTNGICSLGGTHSADVLTEGEVLLVDLPSGEPVTIS